MHENADCFYNLESPAAGASLPPGRQTLRGWLVGKRGTHFVDVRARVGPREFPGVHGFPRADLAAHFEPSRPWLPAEFTIDIDFTAGAAVVTLEALDLTGRWSPFHTVNFPIQAAPALPGNPAERRVPGTNTGPAAAPGGGRDASRAGSSQQQEAGNGAAEPPAPDPVTALEFGRAVQLGLVQGSTVIPPWPRVIRQDHLPFHGYLAKPEAIAPALYGRLEVVGWLFHETQPIRRAFVTTDLVTLQPLALGGEFAGVRERHPGQPRAAGCRFQGVVDVSSYLPAPACVRIFAELADGSLHLCLATHCRPVLTEELKAPWPSFAPGKFLRHWRESRAALERRGVRLTAGPARWQEFWATLRQYRRLASPLPQTEPEASGPGTIAPVAPRALRLLLITHNLNLEGAPLLLVEYATHLIRHAGAQITVLAGQDGPLREAYAKLGVKLTVVDAALREAATPAELRRLLASLARSLDWAQFDLVVANTLASYWGVLLARHARRPSLLYIHESTSPQAFKALPPALLPAVYDAFRHATAVSFNTPATRAYYAHLGSGRNYHLNPAWIDVAAIDAFRAAHPRDALRGQLGLPAGELLVANIGTVCERKGSHDFLRTIEWLWQSAPEFAARCRFVLVGGRDTLYHRELMKDLAATGRRNVQVIPETTRAFDWFGAADLFVCTSYEESFPRVVLEAMAFGVPIASTNVHGIPFLLRDGQEALLTGPGDIAALAAAVRRLLENPAGAQTLATRARARVGEFDAAVLLPRHASFTARVATPPA